MMKYYGIMPERKLWVKVAVIILLSILFIARL